MLVLCQIIENEHKLWKQVPWCVQGFWGSLETALQQEQVGG